METQLKSYIVFAPDEATAKAKGRAEAYDEGYIRTHVQAVEQIKGSGHLFNYSYRPSQEEWRWRVDILVDERRTGKGDFMAAARIPIGARVETTAPTVFVWRGHSSAVPLGTRGRVLGRTGGLLRVQLDVRPASTLLAAEGLRIVPSED
jgi:hypothetical protein